MLLMCCVAVESFALSLAGLRGFLSCQSRTAALGDAVPGEDGVLSPAVPLEPPMSRQPQLSPGPTVVSPRGLGSSDFSEGLWKAGAQCRLTAFPQVALGDVGIFSERC